MNLPRSKHLYSSLFLLALTSSALANKANVTTPTYQPASGKVYLGVFGGVAETSAFNVAQLGTVFTPELNGGPLAVDAFGSASSRSASLFGVQIGYQIPEIMLNQQWLLAPAVEIEGLSLANKTYHANLPNPNSRTIITEQDFQASYQIKQNVFLINTVFNLYHPCWLVQPYVGFGIGGALVRMSNTYAGQLNPPELGINHYNANNNDTNSTFAGQFKAGLSFDINKCITLFAEYRWLYVANTHFTLGSTAYPTHVATSDWQIKLDPLRSNIGTVGIKFNL